MKTLILSPNRKRTEMIVSKLKLPMKSWGTFMSQDQLGHRNTVVLDSACRTCSDPFILQNLELIESLNSEGKVSLINVNLDIRN